MTTNAIVRKVLFPLFSLVHAIGWQTCKSHDEDGMCVHLFGLTTASLPEDNLVLSVASQQRRFWKRLFFGRSGYVNILREQLERREHQLHVRLELVRELNLALTILCGMATFSSSDSIRTQLLFVETLVFGLGAWDTIQHNLDFTAGPSSSYVTVALLLLALVATLGLFLQVSPDVVDTPPQVDKGIEPRKQFDKMPETVHELMHESVQAVVDVSASEDTTSRLQLFPGEDEAGIVMATIAKPSSDAMVGISLKKEADSSRIVVSNLSPTGLFADTPLQVGQTILAINGISITEGFSARDAIMIIRCAEDQVSILATRSIFVMVSKPSLDSKFGFSFSRIGTTDQLMILKIHSGSLLTGTAAQEGMRVLAINQRACPTSVSEAVGWVKTTESVLTLILIPPVMEQMDGDRSTNIAATIAPFVG
jgi:hypothetical protein